LAEPRPASTLRRLFGGKPTTRTNQARREEVDDARILADPPAALLIEDRWREAPIAFGANTNIEAWDIEFRNLFAEVTATSLLTVADMHS
jgi:hypothetical protein